MPHTSYTWDKSSHIWLKTAKRARKSTGFDSWSFLITIMGNGECTTYIRSVHTPTHTNIPKWAENSWIHICPESHMKIRTTMEGRASTLLPSLCINIEVSLSRRGTCIKQSHLYLIFHYPISTGLRGKMPKIMTVPSHSQELGSLVPTKGIKGNRQHHEANIFPFSSHP